MCQRMDRGWVKEGIGNVPKRGYEMNQRGDRGWVKEGIGKWSKRE